MRPSRPTIGSLGFAVLVLAVNLAVLRGVFVDDRPGPGAISAFFLLPLVDGLLVAAYRLRDRTRRTPRAVGFLAAGSVATAMVLGFAVLPAEANRSGVPAVFKPIARVIGDKLIASPAGILLVIVPLLNMPLLVALLGGWVGRRMAEGRATAGDSREGASG